jgi:hypothetical protein
VKLRTTEADTQRAILQYLALKKIWHRRFNVGAARLPGKGGRERLVQFGSPGLPDIMARTARSIIWIEVKSSIGTQSDAQRAWQEDAEAFGDTYILARSLDDVRVLFEGKYVHAC